jgi:hypothetical protein
MKALASLLLLPFTIALVHGQDQAKYDALIAKAFSLYEKKEYKASGEAYTEAFNGSGLKGTSDDRYNAACSWALAGVPDSAIFQLKHIAGSMDYANLKHITTDPDLTSLHADKRWEEVIGSVQANKEKQEANYDRPLMAKLDSIFEEDQGLRNEIAAVEAKYGRDSKEVKAHFQRIWIADSLNQIKVVRVLDERGWLGPDVVGPTGNSALFLVIQHADTATQEKYLPMMRDAVKRGNAKGNHLALLEDRVLLRNGKPQRYGSQIGRNMDTGTYYLSPLEDPDHVDERRASVGLGPLSDYLKRWDMTWDAEAYKKQLPALEKELEQNKQK